MSDDQQRKFELEMRLIALEYMVAKVFVLTIAGAGLTVSQISSALDDFEKSASGQLFPGFDPALSDHANAEWSAAIQRLVRLTKEMAQALPLTK